MHVNPPLVRAQRKVFDDYDVLALRCADVVEERPVYSGCRNDERFFLPSSDRIPQVRPGFVFWRRGAGHVDGSFDVIELHTKRDRVAAVDKFERVRIDHDSRHTLLLAPRDEIVHRIPLRPSRDGRLAVWQVAQSPLYIRKSSAGVLQTRKIPLFSLAASTALDASPK